VILRPVNPDLALSGKGMAVVSDILADVADRILSKLLQLAASARDVSAGPSNAASPVRKPDAAKEEETGDEAVVVAVLAERPSQSAVGCGGGTEVLLELASASAGPSRVRSSSREGDGCHAVWVDRFEFTTGRWGAAKSAGFSGDSGFNGGCGDGGDGGGGDGSGGGLSGSGSRAGGGQSKLPPPCTPRELLEVFDQSSPEHRLAVLRAFNCKGTAVTGVADFDISRGNVVGLREVEAAVSAVCLGEVEEYARMEGRKVGGPRRHVVFMSRL
jgi:hypothetical protein